MGQLFEELKRRKVFRVAAMYVIVSWLVLQVVDVFMEFMPLPEWTSRLVFLLLAVGFPVALLLAWALDLTPDGLRLDISAKAGKKPDRSRRFDFFIFGALATVLGFVAWNHDWNGKSELVSGDIRSLVVLPLDNLINDPEQAYFVQGMHEALITELSKIEAIRVISRTSAMKYKNSNKSVPEIADELGVDAIIEGSVLRAGNTVRVTVQLIDGSSDRHLWADNFDRELTDILALYADITREIVDRIRVEVTPAEAVELATHKMVDPAAYELYLKGNFFCGKWAPTEMLRGIELMRQAVHKDSDFASAHAGLAICLQYAAFFDYVAPREISAEASAAAERAVELDEQLAEAWVSLAGVNYYLKFDGTSSERALKRALEINPSSVRALNHYSWLLGETGRFEEGLEAARRAIRLDPLSATTHISMAQIHYLKRENEIALRLYEQIVELDRHDPSLHFYLGWAQEQSREYDKAILSHIEAIDLSDRAPLYLSGLGHAYGIAGQTVEAEKILEELVRQEHDGRAQPLHVAVVHLGLKNFEEAIDWLEKSFEARNSQVMYIMMAPQFDPLRNHERFARLVDRMP